MKKLFILFIAFSPLCLIGQQLQCCTSVNEVENQLNGSWKMQGSKTGELYHYQFLPRSGALQLYSIEVDKMLVSAEGASAEVEVIQEGNSFEIECDWGDLISYSQIKFLDNKKLILGRDGRKDLAFLRIE